MTLGVYVARSEAEDVNFQYRVLSEFNNNPRLINLSYTDENGNNVIYSEGGLYNRIGITSNRFLSQNRTAVYLTDEIVLDRWRIDAGFRLETTNGIFNNGSISSATVYDNPELTTELSTVNFADGAFTRGTVQATDFAVSVAGLYELTDVFNLYANFSRGFFFPQLRGFAPTPGIEETNYDAENIIQFEAGTKFSNQKISGAVAAYYVSLSDRIRVNQAIVGGNLIDQSRSEQSTSTFGVEATADYNITDELILRGSATYQSHEINTNVNVDLTTGESTTVNEGNELARQPSFLGSLGLFYTENTWDAFFSVNHTGSKFTADDNNIELDAINIARLGVGYSFELGNANESLRLGASVFNLFDSEGITEGNPRAGDGNEVEEAFFFGRPILPRRFFLTATFNF